MNPKRLDIGNYNWYFGSNVRAIELNFDESLGEHLVVITGCNKGGFLQMYRSKCKEWSHPISFGVYKAPPENADTSSSWIAGVCRYRANIPSEYGYYSEDIKHLNVCTPKNTTNKKNYFDIFGCSSLVPFQYTFIESVLTNNDGESCSPPKQYFEVK